MKYLFIILVAVTALSISISASATEEITALARQAAGLYDQGKLSEAEQIYLSLLQKVQQEYDFYSPECVTHYANMGNFYLNLQENVRAKLYISTALAAAGRVYGEHHAVTNHLQVTLDRLKAATSKVEETVFGSPRDNTRVNETNRTESNQNQGMDPNSGTRSGEHDDSRKSWWKQPIDTKQKESPVLPLGDQNQGNADQSATKNIWPSPQVSTNQYAIVDGMTIPTGVYCVYIAQKWHRYHIRFCPDFREHPPGLLTRLTLLEARKMGYTPCSICHPDP